MLTAQVEAFQKANQSLFVQIHTDNGYGDNNENEIMNTNPM